MKIVHSVVCDNSPDNIESWGFTNSSKVVQCIFLHIRISMYFASILAVCRENSMNYTTNTKAMPLLTTMHNELKRGKKSI